MQDNSDLIIRDCCEAEVAEFGQPDTICITVDVLREIVQRHFPGPCLHQIQESAPVQAAVDTPLAARASPTFMTADQARDWAWNKVREDVGTEGWTVMDSVNYHGFYMWGWKYRAQYELQRTATRSAVMQEILSAAPAAAAPVLDLESLTMPKNPHSAAGDPERHIAWAMGAGAVFATVEAAIAAAPAAAAPVVIKSDTHGMNLGQRILHVGGRENAQTYIEFGSVGAVGLLVSQVLRDLPGGAPGFEADFGSAARRYSKDQHGRALLATATGLPAQAVPAFCHVASLKLKSLQERGYQITGYALEKPVEGEQPERGFINHGGFVGWWWDGQSPQAQADTRDASNEWEEITTLPTCDDLIWLYCQDTHTVDGPVAPHPSYEDSWTHWAYANAPSTAAIAAHAAQQEGDKR